MSDKCCKCLKDIDSGPSLVAFDKPFHQECFACNHCKNRITNPSFHEKDQEPYCDTCWNMIYQKKCHSCRTILKENQDHFTTADKSYHKKCFVCSSCHVLLAGKKFFLKNDKLVCERHAK